MHCERQHHTGLCRRAGTNALPSLIMITTRGSSLRSDYSLYIYSCNVLNAGGGGGVAAATFTRRVIARGRRYVNTCYYYNFDRNLVLNPSCFRCARSVISRYNVTHCEISVATCDRRWYIAHGERLNCEPVERRRLYRDAFVIEHKRYSPA